MVNTLPVALLHAVQQYICAEIFEPRQIQKKWFASVREGKGDEKESMTICMLMRDEKEGRSKQGHTNNKAKQHNTPKAVTF